MLSLANVLAQTTRSPTDHCRDFSADAIVIFADAEVVSEAFGLEVGVPLSCRQAADLDGGSINVNSLVYKLGS